jgi:hypothetical protein
MANYNISSTGYDFDPLFLELVLISKDSHAVTNVNIKQGVHETQRSPPTKLQNFVFYGLMFFKISYTLLNILQWFYSVF